MFAILKYRSIWLSNALNMNDHTEVTYGEALFWDEFRTYESRCNPAELAQCREWNGYLKHVPYIFCLSEAPDSLSQWRAYSADGAGVAIGIDTAVLNLQQAAPAIRVSPSSTTVLCKVDYEEARQREIIQQYLREKFPITDNEQISIDDLSEGIQGYKGRAATMKSAAFAEEREWRIVHSPLITFNDDTPGNFFNSNLKFDHRVSGGLVQSHFELPLPPNFLKSITLGPKCKIVDWDLFTFLWTQNYPTSNVNILRSSASYR